jgi:hypothetical protein
MEGIAIPIFRKDGHIQTNLQPTLFQTKRSGAIFFTATMLQFLEPLLHAMNAQLLNPKSCKTTLTTSTYKDGRTSEKNFHSLSDLHASHKIQGCAPREARNVHARLAKACARELVSKERHPEGVE